MVQLLCHLVGDYILQTDRMSKNKTTSLGWAFVHGVTYTLPFLLLTRRWEPLAVIALTHVVIDHFRLARYVVMVKNLATDWSGDFNTGTGYSADTPPWMATWLFIIADNTLHLLINYAALRWL